MFTRILESTIVRKLPAFTAYSLNPIQYRQAGLHNTMIDIDCTMHGETCTVADLMRDHGMQLAFYRDTLATLARDGYVALEASDKPAVEGDADLYSGDASASDFGNLLDSGDGEG